MSTSSSSSRIAKSSSSSSSRLTHMSSSEMKASHLKSDLSELKSSISEMKNLSNMNFNNIKDKMDLAEEDEEEEKPVVTYPESPPPQGKKWRTIWFKKKKTNLCSSELNSCELTYYEHVS